MLKKGDRVKMVNCYEAEKYGDKIWTVRSDPWNVCGSEVVLLEGKSGGFATTYLQKVSEHLAEERINGREKRKSD